METWFWILGWSLSILTIAGNVFIVFLVCRRRRLRTKTNVFVVSPAVADFCVGLVAFLPLFVCEKTTGCSPGAFKENRAVELIRWLFAYKLVQFSPGSLHSCCKASQVLNIHDAQTCFSDDFSLLGTFNFCYFPLRFNDKSSLFLIE